MTSTYATREGYIPVPGGRVWYQAIGDGAAVPLLTVHGGPGATHDYLEPLAELAGERPVIFYDQLGAGESDQPDDRSLWHNERFVDDLGCVVDALALDRVHLFGQS
jgi:proline iminopeptidase